MSDLSVLEKQDKDGGYYAIKGFLYQFDQTLLEVFGNPSQTIRFECSQDINFLDYVIQVKHKEASNFTPSSIKPAMIQLIDLFKLNPSNKFRLYGHFKNIQINSNVESSIVCFTLDKLNKILNDKSSHYSDNLKNAFLENFTMHFSKNYNESFDRVIQEIKRFFSLSSKEMAIYYHAIFFAELSRLAIQSRDNRQISTNILRSLIESKNNFVFLHNYREILTEEKYFRFLKINFFTHKSAHIHPFERIFIIDWTDDTSDVEVIELIKSISKKFPSDKGIPVPFICFRNYPEERLVIIKQELIDLNFHFNDGTHFDGDRFRLDYLCKPQESNIKIRFIKEKHLDDINISPTITRCYHFFTDDSLKMDKYHLKSIAIKESNEILKIIS